MEKERGTQERLSSEFTVVGVINDGAELNSAVRDVRDLGVGQNDLTVVLKRENPDEQEPFPPGTRYIVVPGDRRGLEVPLAFAVVFVIFGFFFAITTPSIGIPTFVVFVSLAVILVAGSLTRVGMHPILIEMEAPKEESESWNEQFERGKVLIFANTRERRLIRPIREAMQRHGAIYYIIDRRLEPQATHQAVLNRAGRQGTGPQSVMERSGEA